MVVAEKCPKMLQLGDQKLCQINRRIMGLKKEFPINKIYFLCQGALQVNPNVLIVSFRLTGFSKAIL